MSDFDATRLLHQADLLDQRADALACEASELRYEAMELRVEVERMTRTSVGFVNGDPTPDPFGDQFLDRVQAVLDGAGPLAMADLTEHLSEPPARIRAALAQLESQGKVVRSGVKRGTRYQLAGDSTPATVTPFDSYEALVRDVAVKLGTFTLVDLQRELPDLSEATLRRWVRKLQDKGAFVSERVGAAKVYGYVPAEGGPTHRPRQAPEWIAPRERGGTVAGTGTTKVGHKELDALVREARAHGVKVEKGKGGHLAWVCPSGAVVYSGSTPSSSSTDKMRKRLRDAGVPV
jgi:hypothetical protein